MHQNSPLVSQSERQSPNEGRNQNSPLVSPLQSIAERLVPDEGRNQRGHQTQVVAVHTRGLRPGMLFTPPVVTPVAFAPADYSHLQYHSPLVLQPADFLKE